MKKSKIKTNYFKFINKIKTNPYLYVSMYNSAKTELSPSEFKILQEQLSIA